LRESSREYFIVSARKLREYFVVSEPKNCEYITFLLNNASQESRSQMSRVWR